MPLNPYKEYLKYKRSKLQESPYTAEATRYMPGVTENIERINTQYMGTLRRLDAPITAMAGARKKAEMGMAEVTSQLLHPAMSKDIARKEQLRGEMKELEIGQKTAHAGRPRVATAERQPT